MAEAPAAVLAIITKVRRAIRRFETERSETESSYRATWEMRVRVERDDLDGGWVAECLDMPGAFSQGETEEEAIENLGDAIGGIVATRLAAQLPTVDPHDEKDHEHSFSVALG